MMRILSAHDRTKAIVSLVLALVVPYCAAAQMAHSPDSSSDERRSLDSHFPFLPPANVKQWKIRQTELRQHLKVSLGLWPELEKTPLNAVEHSKREMDDYSVSCVYFESVPGFFVTGNLYRPKSISGRVPVVLCPYGHFQNGRFLDHDQKTIAAMIARGEESEPSNARSPLQAHCVHLARMGCIVFHYDMVGYADSKQIPYEVAHFCRNRRADDNDPDGWLFFSPRAEMHSQSIMGLQTWNSIRAIDFVQGIEGVDPHRIGVTGCSGGGTQTFILAAVDDRIQAAFAAAMVSTGMQGGCSCENACNLRTVTGNVELAALFAPKPMAFSAANDWTKSMATDGFPELQKLYQTLGHKDNTFLAPSLKLPHGYNEIARRTMYAWFNHFLKIADDPDQLSIQKIYRGEFPPGSIYKEKPFQVLSASEMSVWNSDHPRPVSGVEVEKSVTRFWAKSQRTRIVESLAGENGESSQLKSFVRSLISDLNRNTRDQLRSKVEKSDSYPLVKRTEKPDVIRVLNETDYRQGMVVGHWDVPDSGATLIVLLGDVNNPNSIAAALLNEAVESKRSIVAIDSSQLLKPNKLFEERAIASFTFGYNRTSLAKDARAIAWAIDQICMKHKPAELRIVALDQSSAAAAIAAAARQSDTPIGRFVGVKASLALINRFEDPLFLPGVLSCGDLEGIIRIAKPKETVIWRLNEQKSIESVFDKAF